MSSYCSLPGHRSVVMDSFVADTTLKPEVVENKNSHRRKPANQIQSCKVCNAPANGKFFGVRVCFPCKTFFFRNVNNKVRMTTCENLGMCSVDVTNRSICKACRFAKCLAVGMTRKERPEVVIPCKGQRLCSVCGDIANNAHFGILSCEGCKKFFRRAVREKQEPCKFGNQCCVNPRTRNNCRACRMRRCLATGMLAADIKIGRPKKQRNQKLFTSDSTASPSVVQPDKSTNESEYSKYWSNPTTTGIPVHQNTLTENNFLGAWNTAGWNQGSQDHELNVFRDCINHNVDTRQNIFNATTADTRQSGASVSLPFESEFGIKAFTESVSQCSGRDHAYVDGTSMSQSTGMANCAEVKDLQQHADISFSHFGNDDSPLKTILQDTKQNQTEDLDKLITAFSDLNEASDDLSEVNGAEKETRDICAKANGCCSLPSKETHLPPEWITHKEYTNVDLPNVQEALFPEGYTDSTKSTDQNVFHELETANRIITTQPLQSTRSSCMQNSCSKIKRDVGNKLRDKIFCAVRILSSITFHPDQLLYIEDYWVNHALSPGSISLTQEDTLCILHSYRDLAHKYAIPDRFSLLCDEFKQDRQKTWELARERVIRRIGEKTQYILSLPGFKAITDEDKVVICRLVNVQLGLIIASSILYDKNEHTFTMNFFDTCRPVDVGYTSDPHVKFTSICLEVARQLHCMELSDNECAFVCALLIFATDYFGLKSPEVIDQLRAPIIGAFLQHTNPVKGEAVARARSILRLIPPVRKLGIWYTQWQSVQSDKDGTFRLDPCHQSHKQQS